MKKTLAQLKKEEQKTKAEINRIEEEKTNKIKIPRLKKMIGRCFIYYKNSYSCPKKESDYWNIYRKIIDWVDSKKRGFYFIVEEFSTDSEGKTVLEISSVAPYLDNVKCPFMGPFMGYIEITNQQYGEERNKMIEEMKSQKKLCKILNSKYNW